MMIISLTSSGRDQKLVNYLHEFITNRPVTKVLFIVYGDGQFYQQIKEFSGKSPLTSFFDVYFCSLVSWDEVSHLDYCSYISRLKGEDRYYRLESRPSSIKFYLAVSSYPKTIDFFYNESKCYLKKVGHISSVKKELSNGSQNIFLNKLNNSFSFIKKFLDAEISLMYPINDVYSDISALNEFERISKVDFNRYQTILELLESKNCSSWKALKSSRIFWLNKLKLSKDQITEGIDKKNSDFFIYFSFWFYQASKYMLDERRFAVLVVSAIRTLELFLTGHLFLMSKARLKPKGIEIMIFNHRKNKFEWSRASGFGQVWGCYQHHVGFELPENIINEVKNLSNLRNKTKFGHGYLPVNKEDANSALHTVKQLIDIIENNVAEERRYFQSCSRKWVSLSSATLSNIFVNKLCEIS